jgi:serine phosphatase RsbU (regulator of sigma subunit)
MVYLAFGLPKPETATDGWRVAYHYEPSCHGNPYYCNWVAGGSGHHFFVGEVSGTGADASLLMVRLQADFRTLVTATPLPGELLAKANRIFCDNRQSLGFAKVVVGRIGGGGEVEISNAGFWRPLHLQSKRGQPSAAVASIQCDDFPLGLDREANYVTQKLTLEKGDSLVIYSDDVANIFTAWLDTCDSTCFQKHAALPPQEQLATALEALNEFHGKGHDLMIMIIQRQR